ncbi:MAG: hypothetical protein HQ534_03675 [Armatimonadetes bacterium]|nr:hypothetical protein [Armatimonadota bacterium]
MIDKTLGRLSKRIYDIISSKPLSRESYIAIFNDIVLTFIELRIDLIFSNSKINIEESYSRKFATDFDSFLKELESLKRFISLDFELTRLIPEYHEELHLNNAEDIRETSELLKKIFEKHNIILTLPQLEEYSEATNTLSFPDRIVRKYYKLYSYYKTLINIAPNNFVTFLEECSRYGPPLRHDFYFEEKKITMDEMIYIAESHYAINELIPLRKDPNLRGTDFVTYLYQFESENDEIENLIEYIKSNDIWKLLRIKGDFIIQTSLENVVSFSSDNRLELIKFLKSNKAHLRKFDIKLKESDYSFQSEEWYIKKYFCQRVVKNLIVARFNKWIDQESLSGWDEYWVKLERDCWHEEFKTEKEITHKKVRKIHELEKLVEEKKPEKKKKPLGRRPKTDPIEIFLRIIQKREECDENKFNVSYVNRKIVFDEFELSESYLRSKRIKEYLSCVKELKDLLQSDWQKKINRKHLEIMKAKRGELKN